MADKITLVPRTIHYFNIEFSFNDDLHKEDHFLELFKMIVKMSRDKDSDRYKSIGGRVLFVQDVEFDGSERIVQGKVRLVRDLSPEKLNMDNDVAEEIELKENEGFVETTHFILSYKNRVKRLAIEYNDAGAKAHEIESYWKSVGAKVGLQAIVMKRIIREDVLKDMQRRIGRVSLIDIAVPREAIGGIKKNINDGLGTALQKSNDFLESDSVELKFNFDYKKKASDSQVAQFFNDLAIALGKDPTQVKKFKKLQITGEDADRNNMLQIFDLIEDKAKSKLRFERKPKSSTLVSADFYEKTLSEMKRVKII